MNVSYVLRRLTEEDQQQASALQQEVMHLDGKDNRIFPLAEEEFKHILGGNGLAVGILVQDQLVGFHAALFPGRSADNLGYDLGLSEGELLQVAHLESVFIHPAYRGLGWQRKMAGLLMGKIYSRKALRYFCATVDPANIGSVRNMLAQKLYIVQLKKKYGGLLRYIFLRDICRPLYMDAQTSICVPCLEVVRQQQLLEDGYAGFQLYGKGQTAYVLFAKADHPHNNREAYNQN